jgi:uncharacterized membrane protein
MTHRLALVLEVLRGSFWFLPTVLTVAAAAIAIVFLAIDRSMTPPTVRALGWIYTGGAEGARSLLSTVAGAVVTVVGVAFSVTVVSLQLASTQLGPRVLRNFMRDRGNQAVLGTFVATFVYCLLVLRTVRGDNGLDDGVFIPHLAVTGGAVLAIVSAAVLIYFIHHAAISIQADHVIATVANELDAAINTLYPERLGTEPEETAPPLPDDFDAGAHSVHAPATGHLQSIVADRVMAVAVDRNLLVRLELRPGDFVMQGEAFARVWPPDRLDAVAARQLTNAFPVGQARTLLQDVRFGVEQLVEIAVRGLSSNLRDPVTSMHCIERLGAAVARLAGRRMPSPYRYDGSRLRVIARGVPVGEVVDAAFDSIRERGAESLAVTIHLLTIFERVARLEPNRDLHAALLRQTVRVECGSRTVLPHPWQRETIEQQGAAVRKAIRPDVLELGEKLLGVLPAPSSIIELHRAK